MAQKKKAPKPTEELSARVMAVQACYEMLHHEKPYRTVLKSYLDRGLELDTEDGEDLPPAKTMLFKKIMDSYNNRRVEVEVIVMAHFIKKTPEEPIEESAEEVVSEDVTEEGGEEISTEGIEEEMVLEEKLLPKKDIEPLLKAILLCGTTEILMNAAEDNALIINDYLDVCHSFYAPQQVAFVNGVLDAISKAIEGA